MPTPARLPAALFRAPVLAIALTALAILVLAIKGPSTAEAAATCDKYASASGSNAQPGTLERPFATAQRLIDSLTPGQTGCLRGGTFRENIRFNRGGSSGRPVTLRSQPGERAKVLGHVRVTRSADFVEVRMLDLDGSAAPPCVGGADCTIYAGPWIEGDDAVFADNDVTNRNTAICFLIGQIADDPAERTRIENNRIHHCGRLPATNHDHGIYVDHAVDTRIEHNLIYDNADRGVQFYPKAERSIVRHNVFDGNGQNVHFGQASSGNRIEGNLITNSGIRFNVESHQATGAGNVVTSNCVYGGARASVGVPVPSGIQSPQVGFRADGNTHADPLYANRGAKDFRLRAGSPCRALFGDESAGPREGDAEEGPPAQEPPAPSPCDSSTQAVPDLAGLDAQEENAPETDGADEDSTDGHDDEDREGDDTSGEDRVEDAPDDSLDEEDRDQAEGEGDEGDDSSEDEAPSDGEATTGEDAGDRAEDADTEDADTEDADTEDADRDDDEGVEDGSADDKGTTTGPATDERTTQAADGSGCGGDSGGPSDDGSDDGSDGDETGDEGSQGEGSSGSSGSGGGGGGGGASTPPATSLPLPVAGVAPVVPGAGTAVSRPRSAKRRCPRVGTRRRMTSAARRKIRRNCTRTARRAPDTARRSATRAR